MELMKIFELLTLLKEISNLDLFSQQFFDLPINEEKKENSLALNPFSTTTQNMHSEINNNFQNVHSTQTLLQDYQNSLSTFSNSPANQVENTFSEYQNTTQNQHTLYNTQSIFQAQSDFFEKKPTENFFQNLFQSNLSPHISRGNEEKQQLFSSDLNFFDKKLFNSSIVSPAFHQKSNVFSPETTANSKNNLLNQMSSLFTNPTFYTNPTEIFANQVQNTAFSSNLENGEDWISNFFSETISSLFTENQWENIKYEDKNLNTQGFTENSVKQSITSPLSQKTFSVNIQSIYLPQVSDAQDFMQELQNIVAQYSGNI